MTVISVMGQGVLGMQRSSQATEQVARDIATTAVNDVVLGQGARATEVQDLAPKLVELREHELNFKLAARVADVGAELLGTFVDELA